MSIQLKDFVQETLLQIIEGVNGAQDGAVKFGATVHPTEAMTTHERRPIQYQQSLTEVEFDVAVTATEGKEAKAGIGVFLANVGVGARGRSGTEQSSVNRISFKVAVGLRQQKVTGNSQAGWHAPKSVNDLVDEVTG